MSPHVLAYAPFALAALCGLLLVPIVLSGRRGRRGGRVDHAARRMARGRDLQALTERGASRTAKRLGVAQRGLLIAKTTQGGRPLYMGWEDCSLDVAGPRSGKTTTRVIPAILEAPGAVVTTSNKRDALDATREQRSELGDVWVLDPQGIAGEPPALWWNPLSYVTDANRAAQLAAVFVAAAQEPGARSDAFFAPKGAQVVAALLLAAASSGRTIEHCHRWVTSPRDDEPVGLLREHGHALLADALASHVNAPDKQRAGIFGEADTALAWLTDPAALAWVTPGDERPEFDPRAFTAAGTGTLYLLSREGPGSAGALVAGLTVAVCDAAEQLAVQSPGGRLATPMSVVLDEACNVCKWPELPNLYSHYGSRGLVLLTFAQSWSQLVETFGREGARKLWSAATIKVYGGGVAETEFLSDLSQLCGEYDEPHITRGNSRAGQSTSRSTQRRRVLDVSELAALPKGRAVVLSPGAPPALCRTLPYWER